MIEHCDDCTKPLNKLKAEDYYMEPCNAVYCEEHYLKHMQSCEKCKKAYS